MGHSANHHDSSTATPFGTGKKTLKSYITGLVLSLIFTFTSFYLVGHHALPNAYLYVALTVLAISQLIAQVVYFLRLNNTDEGKWNLMPFLFTGFVVLILVFGSLWIMYNLNYNMMS